MAAGVFGRIGCYPRDAESALPRPEKVQAVSKIQEGLKNSEAVLLAEFSGLRVTEMQELRRTLRGVGVELRILKNTLARLAARQAGLEGLLPFLEGPTAAAFATSDAVGAARELAEFGRRFPGLIVKGGLLSGKILSRDHAKALAAIEPKEVLLTRFRGALNGPMVGLASALSAPLRDLAGALQALLRKSAAGEAVEA